MTLNWFNKRNGVSATRVNGHFIELSNGIVWCDSLGVAPTRVAMPSATEEETKNAALKHVRRIIDRRVRELRDTSNMLFYALDP